MAAITATKLTTGSLVAILVILTASYSIAETSPTGPPHCQPALLHGCTCLFNKPLEVQCMDTGLAHIPEDLPENIVILSFRGNHFSILDYVSVVYHDVLHLDLDHNQIRYIRDNCFQDLNRLVDLYLSNNQISSVRSETFSGLQSLKLLDISLNQLYELNRGTFNGSVLPSLEKLHLDNSKIYDVQQDVFDNLTNLNMLNLSHNFINLAFPLGNEHAFPGLEVLDLSFNAIGPYLNYSLFQFMKSLEKLLLSGNHIQTIQRNAFVGTESSLKVLHLDRNNLYYIEHDTFRDLKLLSELDLSYNKLQVLELGHSVFLDIEKPLVHNNPWHCTCENAWLVSDAIKKWNINDSLVCAFPSSLAGTPVVLVSERYFQQDGCQSNPIIHHGMPHPGIIIPAILVSLFVVMFAVYVFVVRCLNRRKLSRRAVASPQGETLSYSRMEEVTEEAFGESL